MEIYEINNLNCSIKENRKRLLKEAMKVIKTKEKPTKEELENICSKIRRKYKLEINCVKVNEEKMQVNIEIEKGTYSILYCYTYYEALLKFVLYAKALHEYKKLVNK